MHAFEKVRATLQWRSLGTFGRVLAVLEVPFTVARSLTVPLAMTKEWGELGYIDSYGTGFSKLRVILNPLFFSLFGLFFTFIKNAYIEAGTRPPMFVLPSAGSGTPRWVILIVVSAGLLGTIGMAFFLRSGYRCTERGVPAAIRWSYCVMAFVACLAWIDLLAEESVALLESVGFFLNIPLTMIGLTALAWGNCVPDGFAAFLLSRHKGDTEDTEEPAAAGVAMAISGCFGAPIFNMLVVLSVALLTEALQ